MNIKFALDSRKKFISNFHKLHIDNAIDDFYMSFIWLNIMLIIELYSVNCAKLQSLPMLGVWIEIKIRIILSCPIG